MKIDFHAHTNRFSICSSVSPNTLLEDHREEGLDGVVLTEHNEFWPIDEVETLRDAFPELKIFNGAEITVDSLHHVITLLPEPDNDITDISKPETFIREVNHRNGFMIAAHPFRFHSNYDERNEDYPLDGVEVASRGMYGPTEEKRARNLAEDWEAYCFASSDAHSLSPIGAFYTVLEGEPRNERELIELIRKNGSTPVINRDDYSPIRRQ